MAKHEENLEEIFDELFKGDFPPVGKSRTAGAKKASPRLEKATELPSVDPESLAPAHEDGNRSAAHKAVCAIEKRFLKVAGLSGDLSTFPVDKSNHLQVRTDKSKSDEHGEVFTPLWLVDQMIERTSVNHLKSQVLTTRDLCSGYGQFSVRLMRAKLSVLGSRFKVDKFLGETHCFVELQPNSCYRLLYIFGTGIRLCIGDATRLSELPDEAETGIWVWCEADSKWKDMTARIQKKFEAINGGKANGIEEQANRFEEWFLGLQERTAKGSRGGSHG